MASFTITGFSSSSITRQLLDGETGLVTSTGTLVANTSVAVAGAGSSELTVDGRLSSTAQNGYAFHFDGLVGTARVGAGGEVETGSGGLAFWFEASERAQFLNLGEVRVDGGNAVSLRNSDGAADAVFDNRGDLIVAQGFYAEIGSGRALLTNSGSIDASVTGVVVSLADSEGVARFINNPTGVVKGPGFAAYAGSRNADYIYNKGELLGDVLPSYGADEIWNSNLIDGDVILHFGADRYFGYGGRVTGVIRGDDGADLIVGGAEADSIQGGDGLDRLIGNGGDDSIDGGAKADVIWAGEGADFAEGGLGRDTMVGGGGDDTLYGGHWDDWLQGAADSDMLYGGVGADVLSGGDGDDALYGGDREDRLHGGRGQDDLFGGDGIDVFKFNRFDGVDTIHDFVPGFDKVDLVAFGFGPGDFATKVFPALSSFGTDSVRLSLTAMGGEGAIDFRFTTLAELSADDFIL